MTTGEPSGRRQFSADDAASSGKSAIATDSGATDALLRNYGVYRRPLENLIGLLANPCDRAELVRNSAVPRRTVDELLAALAADGLIDADDRVLQLVGAATDSAEPQAQWPSERPDLRDLITDLVAGVPRPNRNLDHVQATAPTVLRRALWLSQRYALDGGHLVCIGDHDLTSLATALVVDQLTVTVVDIDESLLEYLDVQARRHRLDIRVIVGDLRESLPASVRGDLVFSDPPYTPAGMSLFAARAAAALTDQERGRIVLAYGHSPLTPALGWKVQRALSDLHLTVEAQLPGFNRYHGAEAIGSASDLYVCQPTAKTWRALETATDNAAQIYTHGGQSLEAVRPTVADEGWLGSSNAGIGVAAKGMPTTKLSTLLNVGLPPALRGKHLAVALPHDVGPLLVRVLLAANAPQVRVLVPSDHPAIATVGELLAPKFRVDLIPVSAGVVAQAHATDDDSIAAAIWQRAHGKVGKVWAQAVSARTGKSQREAASEVAEKWAKGGGAPSVLKLRLIELPSHQLRVLLRVAR